MLVLIDKQRDEAMQEPIRLVMIYGSVREKRFCDQVVAWAAELLASG